MAIDMTQVQSFSDSDLLSLFRQCLAQIALGQSYTIGNRQFTRADLEKVQQTIQWLEMRVNAADGNGLGAGSAFVQFQEPV